MSNVDVDLEYRGCEIKVNVSYSYYPPSGFSDEPQEHLVEIEGYAKAKTGKTISKRLQNEIEKHDEERIIEIILSNELDF